MTKPTSKVIQISTSESHLGVLCEDGSIWHFHHAYGWDCILEAPTQKPIIEDSLITDEVEKAKEDLKFEIEFEVDTDCGTYALMDRYKQAIIDLKRSSQALFDALDKQKVNKLEETNNE